MILVIEILVACALFTVIMVGGTLLKKEAFLSEYAPAVQEKFLKGNPQYTPKSTSGMGVGFVVAKILMCIFFVAVLAALSYFAGARDFSVAAFYAYTIWFVVNWYDVVALDMGIFAHWKRVRLRGTEDMDKEYTSNAKKHIRDGLFGTVLGIPVSLVCGLIIDFI